MDLYPEALVAQGIVRRNGFLDKTLSLLNDIALASLTGVICLGECQRRRLESYSTGQRLPGSFTLSSRRGISALCHQLIQRKTVF